MIDLKHRVLFVHVPKTGGSAVEAYFRSIRGIRSEDQGALAIFRNGSANSRLERGNQHNSLEMYERFYFGGPIPQDYTVFTVVRDPLARFWSEWKSRRLPPPNRFPFSFRLTTRQLQYLAENPVALLKDLDSHLRPQVRYLEGESRDRVRVLRFEKLADEFDDLCRDLDLPRVGLPFENRSPRRELPSLGQQDRVEAFVREFYAKDYRVFGYDWR